MGNVINLRAERKRRQSAAEGWLEDGVTELTVRADVEDGTVIFVSDTSEMTLEIAMSEDDARRVTRDLHAAINVLAAARLKEG
jgi:hypothetical protein